MRIYISLVFLSVFLFMHPAFSQENMPDEIVDASSRVYSACQDNETYNNTYDCTCLSATYLDVRTKEAPPLSHEDTMQAIRKTCLLPGVDPENLPEGDNKTTNKYSDEELEATQGFYDFCSTKARLSEFYDCKCLASKFIEGFHDLQGQANYDTVLLRYKGECRDGAGMAGHAYSMCMESASYFVPVNVRDDPKPYCECYGRTLSKLFTEYTRNDVDSVLQSLRGMAMGACNLKFNTF